MRSIRLAILVCSIGWGSLSPAIAGSPATAFVPARTEPVPATGLVLESAPDVLLSAATSKVTARLKEDAQQEAKNAGTIAELLETTILPLFDFHHMTQLAVARNWKLASPAQQLALIAEFKTLLVRTYYAALVNYRDETIEYKALHVAPGETDVTVKSTVKKPGVERMTIDYDMEKMATGWKVYDIRVAGISLTTTYRSSFAEIVRDGGVDELIRYLTDKNRQTRPGHRSDDSETRGILFLYGLAPSILHGKR
jgi:phospholipid transport system substrate-binding protein